MPAHRVVFTPSGRTAEVPEGVSLLEAARRAGEPIPAECGGRGACGRCLARVVGGEVPEYRVLRRQDGAPEVLACLTPVLAPLTLQPLREAELPRLASGPRAVGTRPLESWAPWSLTLDPLVPAADAGDLAAAVDVGTTTLRLLLIRLADGTVIGEAGAYNPQIPLGADVISRIVAAEKGQRGALTFAVRQAVASLVAEAAGDARRLGEAGVAAAAEGEEADPRRIRAYVVAGNPTMIHLLLGEDPAGIRQVPSVPQALAFPPREAAALGWPGAEGAMVHTLPAAGGWVGGDIIAGAVRAGLPIQEEGLTLYVDLGTNGEIALGRGEFALTCACSAGPAFEGGGIRCGMRADRGAVDGARIDPQLGTLELSVIGGGAPRGVCGSGLIALAGELMRAGWIDRAGRFTERLPQPLRVGGSKERALALGRKGKVALWERDLLSLVRAKAAVFAGIRTLLAALGTEAGSVERLVVSGNFGRFLNLPAAMEIGLLPALPPGRCGYVDNGALEGAALALLSRGFHAELEAYLRRITYVDLSTLPGYLDEFVAASFLPHTDPAVLEV